MTSLQTLVILLIAGVHMVYGTPCGKEITNLTEKMNFTAPTEYKDKCNFTLVSEKTATPFSFSVHQMSLSVGDILSVYSEPITPGVTPLITFNQSLLNLADTPVIFYWSGVQNLTFQWKSSSTSKSAFIIEATPNTCAYNFTTDTSLVLRSPVYHQQKGGMLECNYTLNLGGQSLRDMVLSFDKVSLPDGKIVLSDGAIYEGATVTSIPDTLVKGKSVTVTFTFHTDKVDNSFTSVASSLSPDCSRSVLLTNTSDFELTSPNFPGNYDNNLRCRWIIESPPGTKLGIFIEDFTMGDDMDHLTFRDGASHSSQLMGDFSALSPSAGALFTTGSMSWIQFETDESKVGKGFRLIMRPILYGGTYRDSGTVILKQTNTSVPIGHQDIDDQIYMQLLADTDKQVVAEFSVPHGVMLPSASVLCYEGLMADASKTIANFTTDTPFYPVFTEGPEMLVVVNGYLKNNTFRANQTLNVTFNSRIQDNTLEYSVGHLGSYSLTQRQIETTGAPAVWQIHAQKDQVTMLKFSTLAVLPDCEVNVYSGLAVTPAKVGHFIPPKASPPAMYLYNGARVEYRKAVSGSVDAASQTSLSDAGDEPVLVASYENIPACEERFEGRSGVIMSPGYPDRYPYNAHCTWTIAIPVNKSLHLAFTDFMLASGHWVNITVVTISTNKTQKVRLAELTNQSVPADIITPGTEVMVEFSSASMLSYNVSTGFRIEFQILDCGGNVTSPSGILMSPGFPAVTKGNLTCVWIVTLPRPKTSGDKNSVSFNYQIKGAKQNQTAGVEIRDGGNKASEAFDVPMNNHKSDEILSRYNQLYVSYMTQVAPPDINKTLGLAFQLNFKPHDCNSSMQCGNGICLHADWRCNGLDDCGDMTDERNCTASPNNTVKKGVAPWAVAVAVILTFLIAVLLTIFVPRLYRRWRNRSYGTLHEVLSPVDA